MINKQTVQSLNLKNYTIENCNDMYKEISEKYKSSAELELALSNANADAEFLNKIWWVLNYHSNIMDNTRRLRAIVETKLDLIANKKKMAYLS